MSEKELYKKAKQQGFSKKEVDALKNFAKIMASKVVKKFLLDCVEERAKVLGLSEFKRAKDVPPEKSEIYSVYKKLRATLLRIDASDFTGYQELPFTDSDGDVHTMRMQLSIVGKDFAQEVRLPSDEHVREFFTHMDKLINVAMQYYHADLSKFIKEMALFFPDDNVSALGINPKNRTLCISENSNIRIGVLCFYVDATGNPIVMSD